MRLETERLILREPKMSDWKDLVEGLNNLEVLKYLSKIPYPYTKKHAIENIKKNIKKWKENKKEKYSFYIELKYEKKIIGGLTLRVDSDNKIGETGSWINQKYWKNGYITEAKIALNDFAFNKLKLRKLESGAFINNKASNIMQTKMGYKYEGKRVKHIISKSTGNIHDEYIYGLLKEDWKKLSPGLKKHIKEKIKKLEKGKN
jgi:[ribosomal protein S5]-alanine N-acetyltransferase